MNTVERIKAECKKKGVSLRKLEIACGFANGYIGKLREGKIPADRLQKVAEYLGVSYNYLLNGEEEKFKTTDLFSKPSFYEETLRGIFETALNEAVTGTYRLTNDEKNLILAYRIAPESTKDIIRKILDIKKDASGSLTEAG